MKKYETPQMKLHQLKIGRMLDNSVFNAKTPTGAASQQLEDYSNDNSTTFTWTDN